MFFILRKALPQKKVLLVSSFGEVLTMIHLLPSPSGKVSLKATEGDNKLLQRFALHFYPLSSKSRFRSILPLSPKGTAMTAKNVSKQQKGYVCRRGEVALANRVSKRRERSFILKSYERRLLFAFLTSIDGYAATFPKGESKILSLNSKIQYADGGL